MTYTCFTVEISEHVARIHLNRPEKANSMIKEFWTEFPDAVNDISNNARARVIVISSEGKHFSSGMDVSVFMDGALEDVAENKHISAEAFLHHVKSLQDTFSCLEQARVPVLVACQGGVIGAGVDLATACDCRYASKDAFFCIQETAIGMTADVGTYPRIAKVIPEGWARQMSYTAERLPAEKAKQIGLINELYETQDEMIEAVMAIARQIAAHSPLAVTGAKKLINYSRDHTTEDALDYIGLWNASMLSPDDIKSTYMAKMQKKAPEYDDLRPVKKGL